jgi:hypothetical protein
MSFNLKPFFGVISALLKEQKQPTELDKGGSEGYETTRRRFESPSWDSA